MLALVVAPNGLLGALVDIGAVSLPCVVATTPGGLDGSLKVVVAPNGLFAKVLGLNRLLAPNGLGALFAGNVALPCVVCTVLGLEDDALGAVVVVPNGLAWVVTLLLGLDGD